MQIDAKKLFSFLIDARENTYAGAAGKVTPLLPGSTQMEYKKSGYLYRDIYNIGNGIFMGLETVYLKKKPIWSMCYYGDFSKMTEEETDKILRAALIEYKDKTRLWNKVVWRRDGYRYVCSPDFNVGIQKIAGLEEIFKGREKVYYLFYAGGQVG